MRWLRLAGILCVLLLTGCAAGLARPPLAVMPAERPAIVDDDLKLTPEGIVWIQQLANAYRENCIAISVLRGEDRKQCDQGLR